MSLNPLATSEHIRQAYLRYLTTAFPLTNETLARQFAELLSDPAKFAKGPYLEATPPFECAASLKELVEDSMLAPAFDRLCGIALPFTRPLYVHQDRAIRKAVVLKRNLVIATGTGSGKTESFLVPILNH